MPPRKKAAAAADGAAPRPTRSSARVAAAQASQNASQDGSSSQDAKPAAKKVTKAKAPPKAKAPAKTKAAPKAAKPAKGKGKRTIDEVDDESELEEEEEEEEEEVKPKAKKAKKSAAVDKDEEETKKMVTVIKRGAAPVDPGSGMVDTHQVYSDGTTVYDAMLNQTDIGKNANKFYVIQLLHPVGNASSLSLFVRWGRVGENGQKQVKGPWAPAAAVSQFKNQFRSKTGVSWESRHGMVAGKGKYTYLERSFEDEEEEEKPKKKGKGKGKAEEEEDEPIPESSLASEIQTLCRLIFSTRLIDAHLSSMNYDANKLPLGKLAKSTILNGFAALKSLSEVIANPRCQKATSMGGFNIALKELTGQYYSIIPHVFGRNRPTVINTEALLKIELNLVDALGDMEVASKLLSASIDRDPSTGRPLNPLDSHFKSLRLSAMDPIKHSSKEYKTLERYVSDTHGATHHSTVKVQHAFRVEREDETLAWNAAGHDQLGDGERLLLWHGSRTTNFAGILKQGLRIAPPEAPVTGYMFGKGVYFADMMSKSANYCYSHLSDNTGLLLLCEVAAKPFHELTDASYDADQGCKRAKARATKGVGRTQPGAWQDAGDALGNVALKGVHMPKGPAQTVDRDGLCLQYNEYIVYDPSQIRVRYLLMVHMT